jgi:excisionase family DNA binding protein
MPPRGATAVPDHVLRTCCGVLAAYGLDLTPAELLRRLTGPDPAKQAADQANRRKPPRLLSTEEAAARLSCSKRMVHRMADDGLLTRRYLRPGNAKSLRFLEVEITALCGLPKGRGT